MKYVVWGEWRYEGEFETETDSLTEAERIVGMAVDEGGWGEYEALDDPT